MFLKDQESLPQDQESIFYHICLHFSFIANQHVKLWCFWKTKESILFSYLFAFFIHCQSTCKIVMFLKDQESQFCFHICLHFSFIANQHVKLWCFWKTKTVPSSRPRESILLSYCLHFSFIANQHVKLWCFWKTKRVNFVIILFAFFIHCQSTCKIVMFLKDQESQFCYHICLHFSFIANQHVKLWCFWKRFLIL